MDFRLRHPLNAWLPMTLMLEGISTLVIPPGHTTTFVTSLSQTKPLTTEKCGLSAETTICTRFSQSENMPVRSSTPSGTVTLVKLLHPENADQPMSVKLSGNEICSILSHS